MFCGECGRSVVASSGPTTTTVAQSTSSTVVADELIEPPAAAQVLSADSNADGSPIGVEAHAGVDADVPTPVEEKCAQCGVTLATSDIFCGECGFVRQVSKRSRPNDTVNLDPFPWGSSPVVQAELVGNGSQQHGSDDGFEHDSAETRIVDRSSRGERFVLQFSTGESVSVTGTGLLGRNPLPEPGEYFDAMIAISDPGKSVSKSHLEFGQDAGAFWVSDRFSGNGTVVREPDTAPKRCDAGKRYRIARGTRVDIGEQFFIVS
jgi:FHA domain